MVYATSVGNLISNIGLWMMCITNIESCFKLHKCRISYWPKTNFSLGQCKVLQWYSTQCSQRKSPYIRCPKCKPTTYKYSINFNHMIYIESTKAYLKNKTAVETSWSEEKRPLLDYLYICPSLSLELILYNTVDVLPFKQVTRTLPAHLRLHSFPVKEETMQRIRQICL